MKQTAILTFTFIFFAFSCTNSETTKNVTNLATNSAQNIDKQTYKSVGVIKKINIENGKITIDHEDIPGYMSPMEMNEPVSDKSLLNTVKTGDKVDFEIERTGEKIIITKLTKIGEVALLNGSEIYKKNCAECHGAKGEGVTKGISLISGHALDHNEAEFIKQVTNGEDKKMPAFKDKLTNDEIAEVVKFVRTEIQKYVKKDEKSGHHH